MTRKMHLTDDEPSPEKKRKFTSEELKNFFAAAYSKQRAYVEAVIGYEQSTLLLANASQAEWAMDCLKEIIHQNKVQDLLDYMKWGEMPVKVATRRSTGENLVQGGGSGENLVQRAHGGKGQPYGGK